MTGFSISDRPILRNDRGVALLIVLLVTALLIALIFEFAYATRISLNSAVNFRDSQRAYFLARSGINAFKINSQQLRDIIPQGEWHPVPMIGEGDTVIMVKWEDESGKIKINDVKNDKVGNTEIWPTLTLIRTLFETMKGIDTTVADKIKDPNNDISGLTLLSGLRQYMSNEDFNKVADFLTVAPVSMNKVSINVNTASAEVLRSMNISEMDVKRIIEERQATPYTAPDMTSEGKLSGIVASLQGNLKINPLVTKSAGYYKVYAYATVGGYTKQIEAIMNGPNVTYWRAL